MDNEEICARLDTLIEVNRDVRQWLRLIAWERAGAVVERALGEETARYQLYEKLDGETAIGEVIDTVPIPRRTVYAWLNEWQRIGIVSKVGRGKYEKIASVDALDIEPPESDE